MNSGLFHLIFDLAKIAGGILLAQSVLMQYDSIDETVDKLAKWLIGFKSLIGGAALFFGTVYAFLYSGCFLMDVAGTHRSFHKKIRKIYIHSDPL